MPSDNWIAEIWTGQLDGTWSCGSGYLVGPRLVLTSTHVLDTAGAPPPGQEIKVRFALADNLWEARCVWYSLIPDVDVTLVEITAGDWPEQNVPVTRWGRLTCRKVEVECEASGFPDVLEYPNEEREQEQLSGSINPGTGIKKRQYHVQIPNAPKRSAWTKGKPWAGMSGAALFSGDLLIGVVVIEAGGFDGQRLLATRIEQVFTDPGFLAALAPAGPLPALESAELAPLFGSPVRSRRPKSPAALLVAELEAVRWFDQRDRDLRSLVDWCTDPTLAFDARLVIGRGGLGKTRLAIQLGVHMRDRGWLTGMVLAENGAALPEDSLGRLRTCVYPLLLIVDYSETRPDVVRQLVQHVDLDSGRPVRILMLARSAGQWWQQLTEESALLQEALDPDQVHPLQPLRPDVGARERAFREAADDIAERLQLLPGLPEAAWPDLAGNLTPPDLSKDTYGSIMRLHLSALVGLLQAGPAREPAAGDAGHEEVLMIHERKYWRQSAKAAKLADLAEDTLANAVTISTLLGATNSSQAVALLGRVVGLRNADDNRLILIHQWLCTLYPAADEDGWGPLEPDRLGEYLVGVHLLKWPDLLDEPFSAAQPEQLRQAFHVLARASADHPNVGLLIRRYVTGQLGRYGPVALRVATETEMPDYLVTALEEGVTNAESADVATLLALVQVFPAQAPAFGVLVERLMRLAITLYERVGTETGRDYRPEMAEAWQQLSDHLDENQRREEALEARVMALKLFRQLAGRQPRINEGNSGE